MFAAMLMTGAFLASPELRVYAANTVFSADIKDGEVKTPDLANNAVTSAKIKDGEIKTDDIAPSAIGSLRIKDNDVKAQDIATDAVGASELEGVSKLIFGSCSITFPPDASGSGVNCPFTGARPGDHIIATIDSTWRCGDTPLLHAAHIYSNDSIFLILDWNSICENSHTIDVNVVIFR
jgi:hypothetical protein